MYIIRSDGAAPNAGAQTSKPITPAAPVPVMPIGLARSVLRLKVGRRPVPDAGASISTLLAIAVLVLQRTGVTRRSACVLKAARSVADGRPERTVSARRALASEIKRTVIACALSRRMGGASDAAAPNTPRLVDAERARNVTGMSGARTCELKVGRRLVLLAEAWTSTLVEIAVPATSEAVWNGKGRFVQPAGAATSTAPTSASDASVPAARRGPTKPVKASGRPARHAVAPTSSHLAHAVTAPPGGERNAKPIPRS